MNQRLLILAVFSVALCVNAVDYLTREDLGLDSAYSATVTRLSAIAINEKDKLTAAKPASDDPFSGLPPSNIKVVILSRAEVPQDVGDLFGAISDLPKGIDRIRIFYRESPNRDDATLKGFAIEDLDGNIIAYSRYPGDGEWLVWLLEELKMHKALLPTKK